MLEIITYFAVTSSYTNSAAYIDLLRSNRAEKKLLEKLIKKEATFK